MERTVAEIWFVIIVSSLFPRVSSGQWSTSPLVNNPICTAVLTQYEPRIISDGTGGTIIAWKDLRSWGNGPYYGGNHTNIYAQHLNLLGLVQWTRNGVAICTTAIAEYPMRLISDGVGGAYIGWEDYRRGDTSKIYLQRIDASGCAQWTVNGAAICSASGYQIGVQLVSDGAGGVIIVWADYRHGGYPSNNSTPNPPQIYAQRVNASGIAQWAPNGVELGNVTVNEVGSLEIVSDGMGGAIVSWGDIGRRGVYAQRVNGSGFSLWLGDGVLVCPSFEARLASDGAGGAFFAWSSSIGRNIFAQRVSPGGATLWAAKGVPICAALNDQYWLQIVNDGAGGAVIAWEDSRSGSGWDIFAQRVNASGVNQWTHDGVPICTAGGRQENLLLVSDGAGGAIVTWFDWRGLPGYHIYVQQVNALGIARWVLDGAPICMRRDGGSGFWQSDITGDGFGGAIITWTGDGSVEAIQHIYAQNVDASGNLGFPPAIVRIQDVPNDRGGRVLVLWEHSHLDALPSALISGYEVYRGVPASSANPSYAILDEARYVQQKVTAGVARTYMTTRNTTGSGVPIYWEYLGAVEAKNLERYSYVATTYCDSGAGGNPKWYYMVRACNSATVFWDSAPDSGYSVNNLLTGVDCDQRVPDSYSLGQNYPNPFNPSTAITYELPRASRVTLSVYDMLGREVSVLVNEMMEAGAHKVKFDGANLSSGVYFYRLEAGDFVQSRKLEIVK